MIQVTQLAIALQAIFGETADLLAHQLGVVRRRRVFTGGSLVRTLVFGWLQRPKAGIDQLAEMAARCGAVVTPQALRQRFTPALNRLLEALIERAVAQVVVAPQRAGTLLSRFTTVFIQDSTVVSLPEEHRPTWPGCGGNASAAALKIQVRWDVLQGGLDGLILEPGRRPDQSTELKPDMLPAGSLWIADLGYFDVATLAGLAARQVFFLNRIQHGTAVFDAEGQRLDLWGWLEGVRNQTVIERAIGLGAQHRLSCRLLAFRCPAHVARKRIARLEREAKRKGRVVSPEQRRACRWTVLVTNAAAERLSAREAYDLYRVRWQIELLFKLWKQGNRLSRFGGSDPERALAEVYAKLLGAIVQHWTLLTSGWSDPDRSLTKATQWIRDNTVILARIVSRKGWDRLGEWIEDIRIELSKTAKITRRKKKPSTFQTMMTQGSQLS
jgi:Transposase DDE domain